MNNSTTKQQDDTYVAHSYARFDLVLKTGLGTVAMGENGKHYLDFTSGIGVNSLGFCDTEWANAVSAQAHHLQHTSNLYYSQPCATLAAALCSATGMSRVFFANSGAEANEGAIKAARKYASDKYGPGRSTIITLQNSFHGRTITTLAATGQAAFHQHFHPFTPGFVTVAANDIEALKQALDETVCAVMIEPVQGEGGVVPLNAQYAKELAALCGEKDVLLIADEVQTGMGRTGTLLACEQLGIRPDIVSLAKGLGGGLPIGAVLLGEKVKDTFAPGDHGSTFGGNPVVCAGANVVLSRLTPDFLAEVIAKGQKLKQGLLALPGVKAVDGLGLMLGIEFQKGIEAKAVQAAALQNGLLCLTAKHKLRLLPPLTVTSSQIDVALNLLKQVLEGELPLC